MQEWAKTARERGRSPTTKLRREHPPAPTARSTVVVGRHPDMKYGCRTHWVTTPGTELARKPGSTYGMTARTKRTGVGRKVQNEITEHTPVSGYLEESTFDPGPPGFGRSNSFHKPVERPRRREQPCWVGAIKLEMRGKDAQETNPRRRANNRTRSRNDLL
jgi:hypothetical protein